MSSTRPLHVLYTSSTCPLHVLYMSFTCPLHVLYISFTCPLHVLYMSFTCNFLYISNIFPLNDYYITYTYAGNTITCIVCVYYISFTYVLYVRVHYMTSTLPLQMPRIAASLQLLTYQLYKQPQTLIFWSLDPSLPCIQRSPHISRSVREDHLYNNGLV